MWLGGTKVGAGEYTQSSTAVPAGYVYVLQFVFMSNQTGARGRIILRADDGTNNYSFEFVSAPARYEVVSYTGALVLKAGDTVKVSQTSCLDGDVIQAGVWGYMMKLS